MNSIMQHHRFLDLKFYKDIYETCENVELKFKSLLPYSCQSYILSLSVCEIYCHSGKWWVKHKKVISSKWYTLRLLMDPWFHSSVHSFHFNSQQHNSEFCRVRFKLTWQKYEDTSFKRASRQDIVDSIYWGRQELAVIITAPFHLG